MEESVDQPTTPTLHHLTSSQSFPVLVALEEAAALRPNGLKYDLKIYQRQRGVAPEELKEVFPLGKSPILVVRKTSGEGEEEVMTEGKLLLQYISDTYTNDEWVPTSPEDKKRDVFFQEFVRSTLQTKVGFCQIFDVIPKMAPFGVRQVLGLVFKPILNHFSKDLRDIYQYMEDKFSEEKPWFSGEKFGLADLNAIFPMDTVTHNKFAWDEARYPKLAKWSTALHKRDAYKKALEKGGTYKLSQGTDS